MQADTAAAHEGMQHDARGHAIPVDTAAGHADMGRGAMPEMDAHIGLMQEMHMRMMADPVIRERVRTDPELSRMMREMEAIMAPGHLLPEASGQGEPSDQE